MITVTNDFKTATEQPVKQWHAYITDDLGIYADEITDLDDLKSLKIIAESSLLRTVMRQAEAYYFGSHDYLGLYVNLGLGIVLADDSTEFIDYGKFKVIELENIIETEETKIKMFDKMYEALQLYDLDPIYDRTFPCTVGELFEAICDRLSWTIASGSETFPNSDYTIPVDPLSEVGITFRDVLDDIAEVAGSIIYFDVNDELTVKQVDHASPLETIGPVELQTLKVQEEYGPINSVVIARTPQEDNILDKDQTSIDANGLTEIKIENNLLVDDDRETAVTPMLTELNGLTMFPFEADSDGLAYFQIGDRITVEDTSSNEYDTVITYISLDITGGVSETLKCVRPDKTSTDYKTAGIIGQRIRNTQIIVNRQTGVITLLNSDITDIEQLITTLTQTIEDIQIQVSTIGGENLLKNSVGLKGDIKTWQLLDSDGDPVDVRNDGTILQTSDVQNNTESGSGIQIANQYIFQNIPTIAGETYTFYCRFNKTGDCVLSITGYEDQLLTADLYVDSEWGVFAFEFEATGPTTEIRLETPTGDECIIADAVAKRGDVTGWVQAPNEVYGSNFKFDKEGFEINSLTSTLKSILDNDSLSIYDTASGVDRLLMQIATDQSKITNLTVQNQLTVQRYENSEKAVRLIATATGATLVINN